LRPAVVVFARSKFGEYPKRFGIPVDDLQGYTDGRITPTTAKKVPELAGKDLS